MPICIDNIHDNPPGIRRECRRAEAYSEDKKVSNGGMLLAGYLWRAGDGLRSSMPAGCDRNRLIHRERLDILVFEFASFFHFGFTRRQHSHLTLSHRLGVGFNQPNFAGEAVHLVGGIYRSTRWSDRVHSTEQESDDKNQYRGGSRPEDLFIYGLIHFIIPKELPVISIRSAGAGAAEFPGDCGQSRIGCG